MSEQLLDEFLFDAGRICQGTTGKAFNESKSPLRPLILDLRAQVVAGRFTPINFQDAIKQCGGEAKAANYRPIIIVLCSKWGAASTRNSGGCIYLPGLAREGLVAAAGRSVKEKFDQMVEADGYIKNVVNRLEETRRAALVDCGKALCWVVMTPKPTPPTPDLKGRPEFKNQKALRVLGLASENILSKEAGKNPQMKAVDYRTNVASDICYVSHKLAQPKDHVRQEDGKMANVVAAPTLSHIGADQTVYIVGHSDTPGAMLVYKVAVAGRCTDGACTKTHCDKLMIDATTLAAMLVDEGLSKLHERIEVIGCWTGGLDDTSAQTVQSFAQRLAGALVGLGYTKIKVSGAMGLTSGGLRQGLQVQGTLTKEPGKIVVEDENDAYERRRQWFPAIAP